MKNETVQYTSEELRELYEIIFLGHANPIPLVLMDMIIFMDQNKLEKELDMDTPHRKKKIQCLYLKEVLFCDKSRLPLMLNHRFYKVVRWRLQHGK